MNFAKELQAFQLFQFSSCLTVVSAKTAASLGEKAADLGPTRR
jgi:hypothetical protein